MGYKSGSCHWSQAAIVRRVFQWLSPIIEETAALPFALSVIFDRQKSYRMSFLSDDADSISCSITVQQDDLISKQDVVAAYQKSNKWKKHIRTALPLCNIVFIVLYGQ